MRSHVGIVFADMDGTFLAASKDVPSRNLQALDVLAGHGVPFVPCTGRPVSAVPAELLRHPATRFVVASNGSVVYDVAQRRNLRVVAMDKRLVLSLYERVRDVEATFDIFADGSVYSERARYEAMSAYGIDGPTLEMLRRVRQPVDIAVPEIVERAGAVDKVTCFWRRPQDRDALAEAIAQMDGFSCAHGHPKNFELQAKGVDKGSALVWLCDHAGYDVRQAVAFGDEANDAAMIRAAGDGVAMANATPEVLRLADHVTLSNDEAGVAHYLLDA